MMSSTLTAVTLRTGTHSDAWPGVSASADSKLDLTRLQPCLYHPKKDAAAQEAFKNV